MSEVVEVDRICILTEEIQKIVEIFNRLETRIRVKLQESSTWDSIHHVSLVRELLDIRKTIKSLCDDLLDHRLSDPAITVSHIWYMIEAYSSSPETVAEGTQSLGRFFKLKMRSMIKPTDYLKTIVAYVQWQNETVRCFVDQLKAKPRNPQLDEIERLWNWNYRPMEGMFLGGAARPLHLNKVTEFAALMSVYYDRLCPIYKQNRAALAEALTTLVREESQIQWRGYEIFPYNTSNAVLDKCLQYFFFKDRHNTWFVNSSASDYIPFVHSAREIFADKFDACDMTSPDQHNTEWILVNLKRRCSNIYAKKRNDGIVPVIVILVTSKNRFGRRIDVDLIHSQLSKQFPTIVTIVDGCQDGHSFTEVDMIIYTKRFTSVGAIVLVNKTFLEKNPLLKKKLAVGTSFSVAILAQLYISINMMNTGLAYGVEDLVNSSRWHHWRSRIQDDLSSTFAYAHMQPYTVEYVKGPIRYSFTEDHIGTILMLTTNTSNNVPLSKLWALLKKQGHSLDCFVIDNPYLISNNAVNSCTIRELIDRKSIYELRQIEALSSDYLAWPLVPVWVSTSDDISVEQLHQHFDICHAYHDCLRISVGRSGYPGKLKRFVQHVDRILATNELNTWLDQDLGKHSSQWPV